MEGSGVTNYSVDKPTYAYTTATTEFDDALLQRDIVNRTQTIVAKGASVAEATRLLEEEDAAREAASRQVAPAWYEDDDKSTGSNAGNDSGDDDDYEDILDGDDDDDDMLQRYRQLRLQEMQDAHERSQGGHVESIARDEWATKVNEASEDGTCVIICLTTTSAHQDFLETCRILARCHRSSRFVTLPSQEALPDWPHPEPSLLVYQYGKLRHEFFRLTKLSVRDLEETLRDVWSVED
jgi:hypothetical protein